MPSRKQIFDRTYQELMHELLRVIGTVREKQSLLPIPGSDKRTWQPNPHYQDWDWGEREEQRIWDAIGEHFGIGPRPLAPGLIARMRPKSPD